MSETIEAWKRAAEAGDALAAAATFAPDVVLISPLTEQFAFRSREQVVELLESVFEVFTGIRFTEQLEQGATVVLFAEGTVRGRHLAEVQRIELDEAGLIRELSLYMRPIPALTGLLRDLGPRVARRQGRAGTGRVLRVAGAFLDSVATSGDRTFLPMASPERPRRTKE